LSVSVFLRLRRGRIRPRDLLRSRGSPLLCGRKRGRRGFAGLFGNSRFPGRKARGAGFHDKGLGRRSALPASSRAILHRLFLERAKCALRVAHPYRFRARAPFFAARARAPPEQDRGQSEGRQGDEERGDTCARHRCTAAERAGSGVRSRTLVACHTDVQDADCARQGCHAFRILCLGRPGAANGAAGMMVRSRFQESGKGGDPARGASLARRGVVPDHDRDGEGAAVFRERPAAG